MAPTLAQPFHRPGWVYEEKCDGWRIVAYKVGSRVQLVSRTATDHTHTFQQIAAAVAALPAEQVVLDGEVAAFDEQLISHMHLLRDAEPRKVVTPPVFVAFDCLHVDGRDLYARPLRDRRQELEAQLDAVDGPLFPVRRLPANGLDAWAEVQHRGLEGLVAKPEASRYVSGARGVWRAKVRREGVFVLAGTAKDRDGYMMLAVGVREGRALSLRRNGRLRHHAPGRREPVPDP